MKKLFPYYHNVTKFLGLESVVYKSKHPIQFIIDNLYLGDYRAADNIKLLNENKINCIINCAFNCKNNFPKKIEYLNLNLKDEENFPLIESLEKAYNFIKENSNKNIFIHCVHGKSRSASVIIFYLMKEKKWNFDESLKYVQKIREHAQPNKGFENELKNYYEKNIKLIN